ncbi:hypothetical protein BO71DRAFT_343864 [Aspergillus ellipticus CBS 707.79]|uniref:Zn(2)-C6 fungal-type domain-containing protein n=1 Tax=Aspergillus ellipticus CBS 707.79 TaxID=1448320 RepID=A0A319E5V2_9EURO|nr:hypothetical protein BO71DRAFT_343864 [Aspergillus ellipticus CBS 707.79]
MDPSFPQYDLAPAPYGHACMNCSQSKCKCILPRGGGRCQRCQRLNKECRPSAIHRRQTTRKSSSKTGRLEKKLDDLVTLLRAKSEQASVGAAGDYAELIEGLRRAPQPRTRITQTVSPAERAIDCGFMTPSTQGPATNSHNGHESTGPASPSLDPTPVQAEEYLHIFATRKLSYFPLIYFSPSTTAQQLQNERPFLWLCIMAVVSKSSRQRSALCDKVRDTVAQRMVHEFSGRDVDFLLGLLVFMAWSNQQVFKKLNLTVFSELAKSVVFDLMINKSPASDRTSLLCLLQPNPDEAPPAPPIRTMEERRAVLGCFLLTSTISLFMQKIDPLRWTSYMDECLQVLSETPECLNDEVLFNQVRFQLMNEKINLSDWHGGLTATHEPLKAPMSMYIHAVESQLHAAQAKLLLHSQRYRIILLHHSNTTLAMNESALLKPPTPPSTTLNFQQLESLHVCLESVKTWISVFLAIPPAEYDSFPFSIFAQIARNLAALYRLSTLDDPAWDKGFVRRTVDIMSVMDRLIGNLGQAAALAKMEGMGDGEDNDALFYSIGKYETVRMAWGAKFAGEGGGSAGAGGAGVEVGAGVTAGAGAGMGLMETEQSVVQQEIQDMGGMALGTGFDDWLTEFLNSMVQ